MSATVRPPARQIALLQPDLNAIFENIIDEEEENSDAEDEDDDTEEEEEVDVEEEEEDEPDEDQEILPGYSRLENGQGIRMPDLEARPQMDLRTARAMFRDDDVTDTRVRWCQERFNQPYVPLLKQILTAAVRSNGHWTGSWCLVQRIVMTKTLHSKPLSLST